MLPKQSPYILHYTLKIIEYLMSDQTEEEEEVQLDPRQRKWREEFIAFGGFEQLAQVFKDFQRNENFPIISFVISILKNYLSATLLPMFPLIHRI